MYTVIKCAQHCLLSMLRLTLNVILEATIHRRPTSKLWAKFPPGRSDPVAMSLESRIQNSSKFDWIATFEEFVKRNGWSVYSKVELKA